MNGEACISKQEEDDKGVQSRYSQVEANEKSDRTKIPDRLESLATQQQQKGPAKKECEEEWGVLAIAARLHCCCCGTAYLIWEASAI